MSGAGIDGLDMRAWLVRRLEKGGHLDEMGRHALLALPLQRRLVAARTDLDGGRGLHLILSGLVCRYEIEPGGDRRIVSLYFPGDLCGSGSLFFFGLPGSVGALSAGEVADVSIHALHSLVQAHRGVERSLGWLTLIELGIAQRWLVNAGRDAERQIAHLLCEIVTRLRATGCRECEAFATGIRQAVIADITAVSLVHVNRVLHALQDADRIRLVKGVITIPDLDRLAAFAAFDPGYLHLPDQVGPSQLGLDLLRGPSFPDGRNSVAL